MWRRACVSSSAQALRVGRCICCDTAKPWVPMCGPLAFGRRVERFVTRFYRTGKRGVAVSRKGTREKRRKRRRRFPSIAARVDTVGCVRLFVRSSSEAMPPSPFCRGCRAKRPSMYSYHRALSLRPCEKKKNRAACGKAAWTQKKGTPPFMGGVHMKKRKEYLTDGQRRCSSSVRSALGQACLSFGGCDSMRHGVAKRSRDM